MVCETKSVDSNLSSLYIAEEECLNELAETGVLWFGYEPNSYSDFGGEYIRKARSFIEPSRQNQKGNIVDLNASGGFNTDFTKSNLLRLLQGFFFADARELPTTQPLNAAAIALTGVVNLDSDYTAAAGLDAFAANELVLASGFSLAANNGLKTVVSAAAGALEVAETLADETPPAAAKLQTVGYVFNADDVALDVTANIVSLTSTTTDFTAYDKIFPGVWLAIGGDAAGSAFANNQGFAKVKTISATSLVLEEVTWTPQTEAAAGVTLQVFFGIVIKNEKTPSLIKKRSFQLERHLGAGAVTNRVEYLTGGVANELTITEGENDNITADVAFLACGHEIRSGAAGAENQPKDGTRVSALGEDAINTTSNIYRKKMFVHDPSTSTPGALIGFVMDSSLQIQNGATIRKAHGLLGGFDFSVGNFTVSGSLNVYFTSVEAVQAIRNNADVGYYEILTAANSGHIFDIPLLGLGGGRLNVEKDTPIMLPLDSEAAENNLGYTALYQYFPYLPTALMAN